MSTVHRAVSPAHVCREVVDGWVHQAGFKVGLHRAADALGVSERWARAIRAGEPARVSAETYLRAIEARRTLRAERRAEILRELAELDAHDDASPSHSVLAPDVGRPVVADRQSGQGRVVGGGQTEAGACDEVTR